MKKLLFILLSSLSLFCGQAAFGQLTLDHVYGEVGSGYGTHGTFKIAVNTVFSHRHIFTVGYGYGSRNASGIPDGYRSGSQTSGDRPQQIVYAYKLMYGSVFYTHSIFRFTLKGGVSYAGVSTPVNFMHNPLAGLYNANYTWTDKKEYTVGLLLDPTAEMLIGRNFGLSVGLHVNANPVSPLCALEFRLIIGRLSDNFFRWMKTDEI